MLFQFSISECRPQEMLMYVYSYVQNCLFTVIQNPTGQNQLLTFFGFLCYNPFIQNMVWIFLVKTIFRHTITIHGNCVAFFIFQIYKRRTLL